VAYWHTCGKGAFIVPHLCGVGTCRIEADGIRYLDTELSTADVKTAFAKAKAE
jgi:hypothetical protein